MGSDLAGEITIGHSPAADGNRFQDRSPRRQMLPFGNTGQYPCTIRVYQLDRRKTVVLITPAQECLDGADFLVIFSPVLLTFSPSIPIVINSFRDSRDNCSSTLGCCTLYHGVSLRSPANIAFAPAKIFRFPQQQSIHVPITHLHIQEGSHAIGCSLFS